MTAFATVDELATLLQTTFDAEQAAAADLALDLTSDVIRSVMGQMVDLVEDDAIVLDPPRGRRLFLPELPVVAIASITVAGVLVPADRYVLQARTGIVEFHHGWAWGRLPQSVVVVYTHGSATASGVVRTVNLEAAAAMIAEARVSGVKGESVGEYSVTYEMAHRSVDEVDGGRLDRPLSVA